MKKTISILLALILVLSVAGCAQAQLPETNAGSAGFAPVTVIDQAGREVVIEKEPQRLVSSYYITTSLLMALDLEDRLVGVEDNAGLRPIYALSCPEILELPSIGTAKELDLESCAALAPDLAILPMKVKDSAEDLEALGIQVILVNPESQSLLKEMIRLVAQVTGRQERAEALLNFIRAREDHLNEIMADAHRPTVYLSGNSNFLTTAGNAMYQSDMIRLAGGENVAGAIEDTYWAQIDYEQLLAWDPEYIILPSSAKYTLEDVMGDPNLSGCRAVVSGNVYQVPGDAESWDSPVPGSILGALWLANILHPDRLNDADCAALMDEYYETFYNFTYSEN